jgi:hypothetical protein
MLVIDATRKEKSDEDVVTDAHIGGLNVDGFGTGSLWWWWEQQWRCYWWFW